MTELGTCDSQQANILHHKSAECINWKPGPPTPRVEIWRADERTLTVARTDGACWNGPDTMFTNVRHEGYWDSSLMRFVNDEGAETSRFPVDDVLRAKLNVPEFPDDADQFSDGTPVALYEGQQPKPEGYPL